MEDMKSKENNEIEKIKVTSAQIVVHGNANRPYYEIEYYRLDDGKCYVGYSSYDLKIVFNWLEECFDIVHNTTMGGIKNTVPQECYGEFGRDLDGCSTQSLMGCSRCICYKEGKVRLEKFEND